MRGKYHNLGTSVVNIVSDGHQCNILFTMELLNSINIPIDYSVVYKLTTFQWTWNMYVVS